MRKEAPIQKATLPKVGRFSMSTRDHAKQQVRQEVVRCGVDSYSFGYPRFKLLGLSERSDVSE
eukprot:4902842-Pleurochrysis_carterae.AAC.2